MMETKEIMVACGRTFESPEYRPVIAYIIGPFAVHRTLEDSKTWTITHTLSGVGIGERFKTKKKALAVTEQLASEFPQLVRKPRTPMSAYKFIKTKDGRAFRARFIAICNAL